MHIRPAQIADTDMLVALWRRSVLATHTFLSVADVDALMAVVRHQVLGNLEVWALENGGDAIGFMALHQNSVEALFMDPGHRRHGGGRQMLNHARSLKGPLVVDVNEQNSQALQFYLAEGFEVAGRSKIDRGGRPFPLLHLREASNGD